MVPEGNSSIPGKIADEDCKADDPSSPSDWSRSVPQFPLPTFKPTMQSKFIYHNLMKIDLLSMNRQVIHSRLVHLGKIVNLICYFVKTSVGSLKQPGTVMFTEDQFAWCPVPRMKPHAMKRFSVLT